MGAPAQPQVIGRYAIYGKIASGGMASVHFGRLIGAAGFARTVAIKRLHAHLAEEPEFLSTMIDEARLAARIHHPNVVSTLDVVSADGELLVVMEYVRGESLARLLRQERGRGRGVPPPIASAIVVGALQGLHAAHEARNDRGEPLGIVHRDVSPQNILVGVDGVARVIDFGVAKAAGRLQTTREGVIKGKMPYMAPEQLSNGEITRRVDVYAMAVVLWEVLTGKRLFQGDGDAAIFGQVLAGAKRPPSHHVPELSRELDQVVMKGLSTDPLDRFPTAKDMAAALMGVVPPAFSTDVGTWVEEVATEGLTQRSAILAEIESGSGVADVPLVDAAGQLAPSEASQPSSLSVETPKLGVAVTQRSRRAGVAGVMGALLAVSLIGALLLRPGSTRTTTSSSSVPTATDSASASAQASAAPRPVDPPRPLATTTSSVPALPPAPSPAAGPTTRPSRPGALGGKPRPSPASSVPLRYAEPD